MQNVLKVRKTIFEKMLEDEDNRKNWEMLCCSEKPFVPFIGAGISAWCYPMWKQLLVDIVRETYSDKCAEYVSKAWDCVDNPEVTNLDDFLWTEEIAECIFDENKNSYKDNVEKFSLIGKEEEWSDANRILQRLRDYVGEEVAGKKRAATGALYKKFDKSLLKESGKVPEYQNYFPILFPDILVTTNYDNALECSYPSILSYSYMDLDKKLTELNKKHESEESKFFETEENKSSGRNADNGENRSWLYRAVKEKLRYRRNKLLGVDTSHLNVTVPDMPMLLKVHGSIERASELALSKAGYDKAYASEIPDLMAEILQESTLIFMGYGLSQDRIMRLLKEQKDKHNKKMMHFAFLSKEMHARKDELKDEYGVYAIFYDESIIEELFPDNNERSRVYHDYFLGLLLENLARRIKKYPQPLELLWEKERFKKKNFSIKKVCNEVNEQFVRREEALQIWKVLDLSEECPLVAVVGRPGSGKSTLCQNLPELQKKYSNAMQFFYISIANCKSWEEFCIRIYLELNIVELEIPGIERWRDFAIKVNDRCVVYWRSVLILNYLDDLKISEEKQELWETIKKVLKYWKEHSTRVVFTCKKYPDGLPCYTWQLGKLGKREATKVFFNACTSGQGRNITYLERKVVSELFAKQEFLPSSINLLGRYASSKSDLTSLLEEWAFYYKPGDKGEQTVARILWNHLLDEHGYMDLHDKEKKSNICKNILWIWGILGIYPGVLPSVFFETLYEFEENYPQELEGYKSKKLTQKTLMSMKNICLCREEENEKQNILLENIVDCVRYNFIEKVDDILDNKYKEKFEDEVNKIRKDEHRLGCFRGYLMGEWEKSLRSCIRDEIFESGLTEKEIMNDMLHILEILGKEVNNNERRAKNKKLNLVLHYEIKTVISFLLMSHLILDEKKIVEVGHLFSHYYHYVPNYAYPLVKLLLQIMQDENTKDGIYKVAEMNRVMGDIQRLMGKKKKAMDYYHQAVDFCHKQILEVVDMNLDDSGSSGKKGIYEESLRIKANVLLIQNYMFNIGETDRSEFEQSKKIYESLNDKYGQAYYNQRMGEFYYAKIDNYSEFSSVSCERIKMIYNCALKLYVELQDKTGQAYIQKCKGDLFIKNRKEKWFEEAVKCYYEAFKLYYENINWRGFANVMQAMGTCLRMKNESGNYDEPIIALYDFAEECYRWLGDVRGLADTLDYAGYELSSSRNNKYQHMAIGKWMESRELWKRQENWIKAKKTESEICKLQNSLSNDNTEEKNE